MESNRSVAPPNRNDMQQASGNGHASHPGAFSAVAADEKCFGASDLQLLVTQMDQLVLASRRKDEFLAILSHELRGPLASIQYGIGVLRGPSGGDSTVQRGMHELLDRQVHQMTLLAAGLLDIGRITSGHLLVQLERLDLRTVLTNAIETLEPDLRRRNQALQTLWAPSTQWVMGDASRLEQVFVNLLANASKYTDAGGKIVLSLSSHDAHAVVRIKDSGIGIDAQVLPNIFDLFAQADAASVRSRSGMGIGLALVRTIVELHAGTVAAASAGLGQGSEFVVRLPEET